jgi:hypothetical protein
MANVIDDQERFRNVQQAIFAEFDRDLVDPSRSYPDESMTQDILNYLLDQIKRDVSTKLQRIETVCQFRINFTKRPYAIMALQQFYDIFAGIDEDFVHELTQLTLKFKKHEETQENSQE